MDVRQIPATHHNRTTATIQLGHPYPLGASLLTTGCNFAVYAPLADSVELCLYSAKEQLIRRIALPGKTGSIWHGFIPDISAGQCYGYRVSGRVDADAGVYHDRQKLLIDPYAKRLNRPLIWNYQQYLHDSEQMMPKAVVVDTSAFDWQHTPKPHVDKADTIIYEAHVKGMTMRHPEVPEHLRGTYLGMAEPCIIEHLKALGITTVQLLPVATFMSEPWLEEQGLTNYWGYNPINFFAPDARYAYQDAYTEFKTLVRALHQAGIEVILDVVYNHSAEGGDRGPILSFRGFNNLGTYSFAQDKQGQTNYRAYINDTGCGNTLALYNPPLLRMVLDSLRYWLEEMQVDGFRFDLAVTLAREPEGFSGNSGFFRAVYQDPVIAQAKLIAEPWDIGPGGYQLGQFPTPWLELNDKFRDTMRAFWKGDAGLLGEFATRFLGSRDCFPLGIRPYYSSVNFITYHDGFTLHDLVSYNHRHNEANREHNHDGHNHNLSWNHGYEGATDDPAINALRGRQKRNLLASVVLACGMPHILGGDELSRTQQGNNNAYCQDNELSWFDWALTAEQDAFLAFCQRLMSVRQHYSLLLQHTLNADHYFHGLPGYSALWWREDGHLMTKADWQQSHRRLLGLELKARAKSPEAKHMVLIFNAADKNISFQLPWLQPGLQWCCLLDTNEATGQPAEPWVNARNYHVRAHSLVVLNGQHQSSVSYTK